MSEHNGYNNLHIRINPLSIYPSLILSYIPVLIIYPLYWSTSFTRFTGIPALPVYLLNPFYLSTSKSIKPIKQYTRFTRLPIFPVTRPTC